jgi:hypothetical protein
MHTHHQRLFVVRPVEDADAPALGQRLEVAPHIVVVQLFRRRRLEAVDLDTLRVDAAHHVLDHAVLPRRVHRLQDDQQPALALGVQLILVRSHKLDGPVQHRVNVLRLGDAPRIGRVVVAFQLDLAPRRHAKPLDKRL